MLERADSAPAAELLLETAEQHDAPTPEDAEDMVDFPITGSLSEGSAVQEESSAQPRDVQPAAEPAGLVSEPLSESAEAPVLEPTAKPAAKPVEVEGATS